MSEKIQKLKASIENDKAKLEALKKDIADKEKRLKDLEMAEMMGKLNVICAGNTDMMGILDAIQNKDLDKLMELLEGAGTNERTN
ncbi:MAG TPA: hypothetical protein IAA54_05485 [Candidatus Gallacutalibacter pullicola]|uniref:DUF4315 family protein n=1 Tax=Candidatus Gallacutalibacter pullicola TaxID=2840830 RepID=A0A9D1DQF0_9FIRM|nr:hypothetical protein [Candidatus Gallacutalibacter pullicola]